MMHQVAEQYLGGSVEPVCRPIADDRTPIERFERVAVSGRWRPGRRIVGGDDRQRGDAPAAGFLLHSRQNRWNFGVFGHGKGSNSRAFFDLQGGYSHITPGMKFSVPGGVASFSQNGNDGLTAALLASFQEVPVFIGFFARRSGMLPNEKL